MELDGRSVLLGPGGKVEKTVENAMCCEYHFDSRDELLRAYEVLSDGCLRRSLEGPYSWARVPGLVVDKFGVWWALYYNE